MNILKAASGRFASAVIVAAGSSSRMGFDKIFAEISGVPVIAATVSAFEASKAIDEIIIVTASESIEKMSELVKKYGITKVKKVICGGNSRQESSLNGVLECNKGADVICIHDGARPFVSPELIEMAVKYGRQYKSACPAIPVTDTIRMRDGSYGTDTLRRDSLAAIQTPQSFNADIIKAALTKAVEDGISITDDCSAAEAIGVKTYIFDGDERNIKLTRPQDFKLAEEIAKSFRIEVKI